MKRLFALLLVIVMVVGLVACSKPATPTEPNNANPSNPSTNDKPFAGKTLQLWGDWADETYEDFSKFGVGNYIWMLRAAVDEWATMNEVTIEYIAGYDQNRLLAAMNSGSKPDLITTSNQFPRIANFGLLKPYTQAEYDAIAEVVGKEYLDMMKYRGVAHGWIMPVNGENVVVYNKTMFENYGVKTPAEHVKDGTWTMSTFKQCLIDMTRDLDGDGTMETYGHPTYNSFGLHPAVPSIVYQHDEKGNLLLDGLDSKYLMEALEFRYEMIYEKGAIATGSGNITSNTTFPMFAMMYSDMAFHTPENSFKQLSNGDQMAIVPMPTYDGEDPEFKDKIVRMFRQTFMATLSSCDEPEAVLDLQVYIAKAIKGYIADSSFGHVKSDYEGVAGTSEYSKQWKELFEQVNKDRLAKCEELEVDWDMLDLCIAQAEKATIYTSEPIYDGVTSIIRHAEFNKQAPASAFPVAKAAFEAAVQKYNDLYIYD